MGLEAVRKELDLVSLYLKGLLGDIKAARGIKSMRKFDVDQNFVEGLTPLEHWDPPISKKSMPFLP